MEVHARPARHCRSNDCRRAQCSFEAAERGIWTGSGLGCNQSHHEREVAPDDVIEQVMQELSQADRRSTG